MNSSGVIGAVLCTLFLAGCQRAMSLEEARKVTAELQIPLAAPPRTIADITDILDQYPPDRPRLWKLREAAFQMIPDTNDHAVLAESYLRRGLAAREIGQTTQELDDLTRAASYATWVKRPDTIHWQLGLTLFYTGNIRAATERVQLAVASVPGTDRGALTKMAAFLARLHAQAGDLAAAERAARESRAYFEEMMRSCREQCRPEWVADGEANTASAQAWVAATQGQYQSAETLLRRAVSSLQKDPITSRGPSLERETASLAGVLAQEGKLMEAEIEARRALIGALRKNGRYSVLTADMIRALAAVLLEEGRFLEAEQLARAAQATYEYERVGGASESLPVAWSRSLIGSALVGQRRWGEAVEQYHLIAVSMASDADSFRRFFSDNLAWAFALLNTGKWSEAEELLNVALTKARRAAGDSHPRTLEVRGLFVPIYVRQGELTRALSECRVVTPVMMKQALEFGSESIAWGARGQRVGFILKTCVELLIDIRGTPLAQGTDVLGEAFRVADAARSGSVQRALQANMARAVAGNPELARLVREEQDLGKQVGAITTLLADVLAEPSGGNGPAVRSLATDIARLRQAHEALLEELDKRFPSYRDMHTPNPASIAEVRAALRPGEALVAMFVTESRTFVWAVPQNGPLVFADVAIGESALTERVAHLRSAVDADARTVGDIKEFDVAAAYALYARLLKPVEPGWKTSERVFVVTHGALSYLPFGLLPTEGVHLDGDQGLLFSRYRQVPWLIRSHAVMSLPSAASLKTLRSVPSGRGSREPFVGFGDPYFSEEQARQAAGDEPSRVGRTASGASEMTVRKSPGTERLSSGRLGMLPRLPETADEIRNIAVATHADLRRDVFLGKEANEERVRTMDLSKYRIIAFATHGLMPGDLDGLTQPALALTAPEVAGVGGDGLLTVEKVLALRLNADWVVLSACNTASGNGAGAEAISGLGRAFFYAGARSLLVSNWPVETTSARELTSEVFRRQAANPHLTRAKALQQAMNALIDGPGFVDRRTNTTVYNYAHPMFWAAFTLVGDGG